ncbi:hypothetical protein EMCRGX_G022919 [Ephydatia muelleri]
MPKMSVTCRFGAPEIVIPNQGREFVNEITRQLYLITKTEHRLSSAYHPQTNGLTERFNQTLSLCLAKMVDEDQKNWDVKIETVLMGYRASCQASTKYSPLLFQKEMHLPIDNEIMQYEESHTHMESEMSIVIEALLQTRGKLFEATSLNISLAQREQKELYDSKHNPNELQVGTTVLKAKRILVKNSVKVVKWMTIGLAHILLIDALEKIEILQISMQMNTKNQMKIWMLKVKRMKEQMLEVKRMKEQMLKSLENGRKGGSKKDNGKESSSNEENEESDAKSEENVWEGGSDEENGKEGASNEKNDGADAKSEENVWEGGSDEKNVWESGSDEENGKEGASNEENSSYHARVVNDFDMCSTQVLQLISQSNITRSIQQEYAVSTFYTE